VHISFHLVELPIFPSSILEPSRPSLSTSHIVHDQRVDKGMARMVACELTLPHECETLEVCYGVHWATRSHPQGHGHGTIVRSRSPAVFTSQRIGKRWWVDKLRLIEKLHQWLLLAKRAEWQPSRRHPPRLSHHA
jgi:hypothetical protein